MESSDSVLMQEVLVKFMGHKMKTETKETEKGQGSVRRTIRKGDNGKRKV